MVQDYTSYKIENYILKITGVFNYNKKFIAKSSKHGYNDLIYSKDELSGYKDYFYPDYRKQFFSNDKNRHKILVKDDFANSTLVLTKYNKESTISIVESRLDLFEDAFGLFTLKINIESQKIDLATFSDAAFLVRNFEASIKESSYKYWHNYIDAEILLGMQTKGNSIKVDEYSGSKYKLYMILDLPELIEKEEINAVLFDIGTLSKIGSAIDNSYDSMDSNYMHQLLNNNSISIYNNYKGLALLDTFTIVGNKILDLEWKKQLYANVYYGIYLYCLFLKFDLFKYNYEIADLDEDRRSNFQFFLAKYYYNYISYNFLPTEFYIRIKSALDIDKELALLNEKIDLIGMQLQEAQQDRTNKILGIVTVLSSLSSAQPLYDYLLIGQEYLGWDVALYWTLAITLTIIIASSVAFYVFGKNILKWINKRKKQ